MNVTEIARKLKITPDELREALPLMGFDIGKRAIKVPDHLVEKIIQAYQIYRRHRQMEEEEKYFQDMKAKKIAESGGAGSSINLPEKLTVRELSDSLGLPVAKVMSEMMRNGIMATINQSIDFDTASIIAGDLGYSVSKQTEAANNKKDEEAERLRLMELLGDASSSAKIRPPVVVVMGHVDHGKTSLLDAIRTTTVASGESGGITQHIGAYQVEVHTRDHPDGRKITVLDTPGHEAFNHMRSRGGRVADIAILVVAADDGIQPQTIESLEIIQKENLPFIVAINKIDKPEANIERVKTALAELNVIPEEYGGTVTMVPLSAKTKDGISTLLDMILLTADMKNFVADYDRSAIGTVIESNVNRDEGATATVLIQTGTLKRGDLVVAGDIAGKVRAMKDYKGESIDVAEPGMPVQILGFKFAPSVGDVMQVVADKDLVKEILKKLELEKTRQKVNAPDSRPNELKIYLVTDVMGTLEALEQALDKITVGDKGRVKVVKKVVGDVTEAHILEAADLGADVYSFKAKVPTNVETLAKEKKVELKSFNVIYDLLQLAEDKLKTLIIPEKVRKDIGTAKVLAVFRRGPKDMVVGAKVLTGVIRPKTKAVITRDKKFLTRINVDSVQMGKEAVGEMSQGAECGLKLIGDPILEVGDTMQIYFEELE